MKKILITLATALLLPAISQAGISLSATRIVFPGAEKQTTIRVNNSGKEDGIFQVWLDKDNDPYAEIPFTVVPPFSKVSAGGGQILRILSQGSTLPNDRESIFWLNVQEIPKVSSEYAEGTASGVSFTIRQRIKLFYRPTGVTTEPIEMSAQLGLNLNPDNHKQLVIQNKSANYITLINMSRVTGKGDPVVLSDVIMLEPQSSTNLDLNESLQGNETLRFESMSDYGFAIPFEFTLKASAPVQAKKIEETDVPN